LLYDSKFKHFKGKIFIRWLGPYEVIEVFNNGSVRICTIDDDKISFVVNGHWLNFYHKPLSRDQFLQEVQEDPGLEMVHANNQRFAGSID